VHLPIPGLLSNAVNRAPSLNGTAFDPGTPFGPPQGRYRTVHYGIMVPNLPEPYRFVNVIAVIGQPRVKIFRNEHLITTSAADTACLLNATGAMTEGQFTGYSIARDCEFHGDGSLLRFGSDLVLEGSYPDFVVRRTHPEVDIELRLTASGTVSHFAKLISGVYDHWSLLCEYTGNLSRGGQVTPVAGLCTLEYARAADLRLPFRFFTYHVINADERTQILLGEVLGPLGSRMQRAVYVRSLDGHGEVHTKGFDFAVQRFEDDGRTTPEGTTMRLPEEFSWGVADDRGGELIQVRGRSNGDYTYGLAGGYAGSYEYEGRFRGKPIQGSGYIEYIDGRPAARQRVGAGRLRPVD
jgi:hypothetical protein